MRKMSVGMILTQKLEIASMYMMKDIMLTTQAKTTRIQSMMHMAESKMRMLKAQKMFLQMI